jgi:ribosomal protein L27
MSRVYKTAKGKMIDMDKVKLANEQAIAVGNMKVNARGDKLGPGGQVVAGRNEIADQVYAVDQQFVSHGYSPNDPSIHAEAEAVQQANRAKELNELASNLAVPQDINSAEAEPTAARGSLAQSIAKSATVNQQPLPKPNKSNGPSRI